MHTFEGVCTKSWGVHLALIPYILSNLNDGPAGKLGGTSAELFTSMSDFWGKIEKLRQNYKVQSHYIMTPILCSLILRQSHVYLFSLPQSVSPSSHFQKRHSLVCYAVRSSLQCNFLISGRGLQYQFHYYSEISKLSPQRYRRCFSFADRSCLYRWYAHPQR